MKLLLCIKCNQIFNLSGVYKECDGNHGGGQYINRLDAKVWGDRESIFVLGFTNSSLGSALRNQLQNGDLPADFGYGGRVVSKGREFTAFIIPDSAASIIRTDEKFDPVIKM